MIILHCSDKTHAGFLVNQDTTLTFVPLKQIVDDEQFQDLLDLFDQESQTRSNSSLQQMQDAFLDQWYRQSDVATIELVLFSEGFVNPEPNNSYITLIGGILVSRR